MYTDEVRTPHALKKKYYASINEIKCRVTASGRRSLGNNNNNNVTNAASLATPKNGAKQVNNNQMEKSPQMCPSTICTPPPKRLQKVRNPFESALTERLHLPLIASPSLFQCRSRTPQLCSTQFEWDIEEVSQLKPADVEPHETQFHDSPDPEQESKAQLAISTFFKESHIVPSPVDCPLRKQRIILNDISDNTPISNRSKPRSQDCEVQTELSLPPVLPKALEEALLPYLQPHLAGSHTNKSRNGADLFNISMRRKLFDLKNVIVIGENDENEQGQQQSNDESHSQMVGSSPQAKQTLFAGRLSDSTEGSSSFGCLSPIRNLCGLPPGTPDDGNGSGSPRKRKKFLDELNDLPSPIAPSEHLSRLIRKSSNTINSNSPHVTLSELTGTGRTACKFTPDRSSSPMALEYSTDCSINVRVGRLRVNSARQLTTKSLIEEVDKALAHRDETQDFDTDHEDDEDDDGDGDGDAMQLSQLSMHSLNYSSSNSDTPRGHRRRPSANRKNLSQSFSANMLNDSDKSEEQPNEQPAAPQPAIKSDEPNQAAPRIVLYRTDSGFNETNSTSNFACSQELPSVSNYDCNSMDVSMACCSTPSTRD